MSTQPLTFNDPPAPIPASDILATVLQCKDPDVALGQKVKLTGYIAIVNSITRRNTMGSLNIAQDVAHAFELGDLRFDDQGAPFERQRVDNLPEDTYLLPEVWATLLGYDVLDWDGWNDVGRNLNIPCTRGDFNRRITTCTIKNLAQMVSPKRRFGPQDFPNEPTFPAVPNEIKRTSTTKTPCCGYPIPANASGPIFWNEYNNVVQCHNCGQTFCKPDAADERLAQADIRANAAPPSKLRDRLPDTRYALTHKFNVGGQKGYVTVGFYDIGDAGAEMDLSRPGEVFVVVQRQGSTLQGFADAWARSVSMLLQYGVPVSEVCRMFAWHKFEPRGVTPNPDIRMANSIVDYVARWLGHTCIAGYQPGGEPVAEVPDQD
jgi:hypothetical protein